MVDALSCCCSAYHAEQSLSKLHRTQRAPRKIKGAVNPACFAVKQRHVSSPDRLKISRVIGAAHQRSGSDMEETFLARHLAVVIELFRRDVFHDRQMIRRRA